MNTKRIYEFLEKQGLDEIDEIEYKGKIAVFNFVYTFDEAEIEAAKAYANDNYEDKGEDVWYDEYFLPYLVDIAVDNVKDIAEDLAEEFDLNFDFVTYELDRNFFEQCEFVLVVSDKDVQFDIDKVLDDLEL
ncbi:MAG: hypothetical protein N2Z71_00390 [Caloramator sp.]|nr:hypothetical protein [Caloramator sp.]